MSEPAKKKSRQEEQHNDDDDTTTKAKKDTIKEETSKDTNSQKTSNIIRSDILGNVDALATSYQTAKPYPHGVLENMFVDGFLEQVLHEVKHNLKAKFKESDLFRVYQSIDLANLDPNNKESNRIMPSLLKLRETLYSTQHRKFIEQIANIEEGTLTNQVDSAVNCHVEGCHLLCHDDVIGTRRISYIIYLTDNDTKWDDCDGGRLELYNSVLEDKTKKENGKDAENESSSTGNTVEKLSPPPKRVPEPFPVKTILPKFNSMAYFVVEPGVSFHSVQEVFCDRTRLSIQGWYHAKETPSQMEHASLNQLKTTEDNEEHEGPFIPMAPNNNTTTTTTNNNNNNNESKSNDEKDSSSEKETTLLLLDSDLEYLSDYINPTYLDPKSIKDIKERFEEESSVQLRHFLKEEWSSKVQSCCIEGDDYTKDKVGRGKPALDYNVGVTEEWKPVGPAHKQRFLEYVGKVNASGKGEIDSSGELLSFLKKNVFESPVFGRLLESYTSLGVPLGYRGRVRRFRPGLDYTIAHYGILTKEPVLDATMCFAAGKGNQSKPGEEMLQENEDDELWQSDDKGGFECYIAADDDNDDEGEGGKKKSEAADEYDEEDDTKLLSVSASNNTLSLVYRDPGTMRFVKYVSCAAPSSRWDIGMEYELEVDDEDDEDNEEEELDTPGDDKDNE